MLRHLHRTVKLFDTAKYGLFLILLAGCNGSGERAGVRGPVYYERDDPRSLDPALSTDVTTGEMIALLFDGLTQFDGDGRLLPALSDRWTADRTGQRYVFHLRAGVSFHDGRPVVAADVKRSFLRVLNPAAHRGRVYAQPGARHLPEISRDAGRVGRAATGACRLRPAAGRHGPVALCGVAARRLPAVCEESELLGWSAAE